MITTLRIQKVTEIGATCKDVTINTDNLFVTSSDLVGLTTKIYCKDMEALKAEIKPLLEGNEIKTIKVGNTPGSYTEGAFSIISGINVYVEI